MSGIGLSPSFCGPTSGGAPPADTTLPQLSGTPEVHESGAYIDFSFNETMDITSTPAAGDMDFDATTQATIASFAWQSITVLRATLASHRVMGSSFETVLIDYVKGTNRIRDVSGNELAAFSNQAVTNNSIHAPMVQIETIYATATWTSPSDLHGTSNNVFVEIFGGGEAGVTNTGAGRAAYYANKTDTCAPSTGYALVIGDGGVAPGGDGTDSTWRSTVCVAPGAGSATSAVGDVTRVGGAGSSGAGARNGGATSGRTSAASGATPGQTNGAPGHSGDRIARTPGCGGASGTAYQRDGAVGMGRITCYRAPPLNGPYPVAAEEYRDAAAATTRDFATPGTHVSGDIAVATVSVRLAAVPACAQATEIGETANSTTCTGAVYARTCDGTDTLTVTSTSATAAAWVYRIRGSTGIANVKTTATTGSATAPTPVTHSPTGGSILRMAIAVATCSSNANANSNVAGHPSGYLGPYTPCVADNQGIAQADGVAFATASSYTPGAFGAGAIQNWVARVVTVE